AGSAVGRGRHELVRLAPTGRRGPYAVGGRPHRRALETGVGVQPSAPPPRPQEGLAMTRPRGEATRRRLLDEAVKQFGRGGYEGTSLESVAGAAGVRKQTLLYYFPSKEALLEACIGKTSERVAAALSEALEAESSSSRKAEAVIHTIFRLAEEWPEFPQFVREAGRLGPDVVERFAGVLE